MDKSKFIVSLLLLCFLEVAAEEPILSKKETLFSTKNGNAIGEVQLSIAPKSASPFNKEWVLIIGSQGGKLVEARNETTLWIFNQKMNVGRFKKDLKNQDYPVEVKGFNDFIPFSENDIRFLLKDWEEIRKQTMIPFMVNASAGEKVTLRLVFYTATTEKKHITIDDEAKVKLEFEIPDFSKQANQSRRNDGSGSNSSSKGGGSGPVGPGGGGRGGGGGAHDGETISLTEKISPEATAAAAAKLNEEHRADSLAKAEAANKVQRIALLNTFISERNREITEFQNDINVLLADETTMKVNEMTIDSLSTIANEMKNKVDYWEHGYSDILLSDEAIHDKFSKFRIAHALTVKKIEELKDRQNPLNAILAYVKNNILMSIGIGVGGFVFMKFLMKFIKKMTAKLNSKIKQQISKAKSNASKAVKDSPKMLAKKRKKKNEPDDDFDNIDISDLAEI